MKLIDAARAGNTLGVSTARVYELARTGILPPGVVVHIGRQLRINEDALADWIRAGGQALPGEWRREPLR